MIGIWRAHAGAFLQVAATATLLFAAPMLFVPLAWARALRWRIPADTDLAVYFGRCLGGVVCVLAVMGYVAARTPAAQPFYFLLMLSAVGVNILVHVWGALRRIQPRSETIEIAAWALLFVLGLAFFPSTSP